DWLVEVHRFVALVMVAVGFHLHERAWRRRRMGREVGRKPKVKPPAPGAETNRLIERAAAGDDSCHDEVLALLDDPARGPVLVQALFSMANIARNKVIEQVAGKDILATEAIHRKLESIRIAMEGDNPSAIEMLLAERIATCWLVVWRYEYRAANVNAVTMPQGKYEQHI